MGNHLFLLCLGVFLGLIGAKSKLIVSGLAKLVFNPSRVLMRIFPDVFMASKAQSEAIISMPANRF